MKVYLLTASVFVVLLSISTQNQLLTLARNAHTPDELSPEQIEYIAKLSNISHIEEVFDNLLVPRVVGTKGHEKVKDYIVEQLKDLGWDVEVDEFEDNTPTFGMLAFKNIIARLNPNADRFLTLACHYDSKFFKDNDFIGATDSAVPCAMMLNLAAVMKKELNTIKDNKDVSLKLIFFDGEEAFDTWGPNDSIYGAKHLAKKWQRSLKTTSADETVTDLNRIDVLVLLDLIGVPNPKFYCFFEETQRWYERLSDAEEHLANAGLLANYAVNDPQQTYFNRRTSYSFIEDDHLPFLKRRVPVVHVIPVPFPEVWHTPADDRSVVDISTVENINKILRIFVAEYLHVLTSDKASGKPLQVEL